MKNVLITGGNGQLGRSLRATERNSELFHFTFTDVDELNLTDAAAVRKFFNEADYSYIINCAAFTDVNGAETLPEKAFLINESVPALLGEICIEKSISLLHLSTDFVFDGTDATPYEEYTTPKPLSVYGKSKQAGEEVLRNNQNAIIIRTSWLYGEYGQNFMKTILRLANARDEISVVNDQTGTPTYSGDLANCLVSMLEYSEKKSFIPGIYHYSNEGACTWFDFAQEIVNLSGLNCRVKPIKTDEYPLPAKRPAYSVLDTSRIKNTFGIKIPFWKESLRIALYNLEKNKEI